MRGNAAGHTSEILEMGVDREVPFLVQAYETSLNIQIWKSYVDDILLELIGPDGQRAGYFQPLLGPRVLRSDRRKYLFIMENPVPTATIRKFLWILFRKGRIWTAVSGVFA